MGRSSPGMRFVWGVTTVTLLFVTLGFILAQRNYTDAKARALQRQHLETEAAGANAERLLRERLDLLTTIARSNAVVSGDVEQMRTYFERIDPVEIGFVGGLSWINNAGVLQLSAPEPTGFSTLDLSDRQHVRAVLDTHEAVVGEAVIGRTTGEPLLPMAVPSFDQNGQFSGIVVGSILLRTFSVSSKEWWFGSSDVLVLDRANHLIVRPGSITALDDLSANPLTATLRGTPVLDLQDVTNFSGDGNRVITSASAPTGEWIVLIDRDAGDVFGDAWRTLLTQILSLAGLTLTLIGGAIVIGRRTDLAAVREAATRAELAFSERRLRALTEATTQVIWTVAPDGSVVDPVERWSALTGIPADQIRDDEWLPYVHPEDKALGDLVWKRGIEIGSMIEFEQRVTAANGEQRDYLVRAVPVREDEGAIREWIGVDVDVTDQRRAEEAIRARETFARDVIDSLFAFVGVMTPDGTLIGANKAALTAAGLDEQAVIGKPFWETQWWSHDEATRDQLRDAISRALAGEFVRYDVEALMAQGRLMTIDFAISSIRDGEGNVTHLVPSATDITERVSVEREMAQSEERNRALVEAISTVVWRTDPGGSVSHIGDEWTRTTGQPQAGAMGWGWLDAVHPDDRAATEQNWKRSLANQSRYADEYRLRTPNGDYRYSMVRGVPIVNADGSVREWIGVNTDVHDRRRAEEQYREAAGRLALALEAGQLHTWDWDVVANRITLPHPADDERELSPYTLEEFIQGVYSDDREMVRAAIDRSLTLGEPYEVEYRVEREPGVIQWIFVRGEAFHDEDGRPVRMLGVDADITRRKQQEAFERAFLANVAHDIKNPLAAVKAQVQLLRRRLRNGRADLSSVDGVLELVDSGLERMNRRIEELSDVARLRAGHEIVLRREPSDLTALVRGIVDSYRQVTDRHRIVLEMPERSLMGMWDAGRIERVLDNLLSNAVKYSPDGGEIVVRAGVSPDAPTMATVEVVDSGIGIPSADLPYIFERYRRAGNTALTSGTGIGLAGARQIVEQHGGTIEIKTAEGVGSTFIVSLPMGDSEFDPQERRARNSAVRPANEPMSSQPD